MRQIHEDIFQNGNEILSKIVLGIKYICLGGGVCPGRDWHRGSLSRVFCPGVYALISVGVILYRTLWNSIKQWGTLPWLGNSNIFSILINVSPTLRKQKNPVLPLSRKTWPFWKILHHQLLNAKRHAHTKFAPLDFINKIIMGKCGKTNTPFLTVKTTVRMIVYFERNRFCNICIKRAHRQKIFQFLP